MEETASLPAARRVRLSAKISRSAARSQKVWGEQRGSFCGGATEILPRGAGAFALTARWFCAGLARSVGKAAGPKRLATTIALDDAVPVHRLRSHRMTLNTALISSDVASGM